MLMIALTAREFGQSPYDYLFGDPLKLAIDLQGYRLIAEAKEEAKKEADAKNPPRPTPTHGGL